MIEENKDSFVKYNSQHSKTIWSEKTLQHEYAIVLLEEKRLLTVIDSNDYKSLSRDIANIESYLALKKKEEMDAAIRHCSERHSERAEELAKLGASFSSGEPLLDENGKVGNDRIKVCQDKIQQGKIGKLSVESLIIGNASRQQQLQHSMQPSS